MRDPVVVSRLEGRKMSFAFTMVRKPYPKAHAMRFLRSSIHLTKVSILNTQIDHIPRAQYGLHILQSATP